MPRLTKHDSTIHSLSPRLRVISNGDDEVNVYRSCLSSIVASSRELAAPDAIAAFVQASPELPFAAEGRPPAKFQKQVKLPQRPSPKNAYVNVFIEFLREVMVHDPKAIAEVHELIEKHIPKLEEGVPTYIVQNQNLLSATVPVSILRDLAARKGIAFIHASEPVSLDVPVGSKAPAASPKRIAQEAASHKDGENIVIGIIDVGGFDFAHPDFIDSSGKTRFHRIWDQGGQSRSAPAGRYGSEITGEHMNQAIAATSGGGLPAHILEPQSQMAAGSHGTHVASIAAGKSGVCPKATIAAVLINVPTQETEIERRRFTFSDSSRIAHAVDYLLRLAESLKKPISINISLGTNGGSHDGAGGISRWIDAELATPGRAVCIAAGNAGQEKEAAPGDIGWIMGRIHTSGQIQARDLEVDLEWTVVGDGIEDFSENELEIWYPAQDRFRISVQAPGDSNWLVVDPRQFIENRRLADGTRLSIYSELYHPTNGVNYISMYLSPNLESNNLRGIRAGVWRVRLRGLEIRDGRFNAWIERDDPRRLGEHGARRFMAFPSFFSAGTNVDSHSISSLACGRWQISVGNLNEAKRRVGITSSQGPTRDNRTKPDIVAPGTDIVAARAFTPGDRWVSMSGTSMASPYVCGVVGLMLAVNPRLNSAQCAGILQRTSQPLPGADFKWRDDAGFGRIDPVAAIQEARGFEERTEVPEEDNQ